MEFVFVGEVLALDFANTEVVVRGKPGDLLSDPPALAAWWRAALAHYPEVVAEFPDFAFDAAGTDPDAALAAAKELRGALRRIAEAVAADGNGRDVPADDAAILNRVLRSGHRALAVAPDGGPRSVVAADPGRPEAALLPVAWSALDLLTGKDAGRLHRCANERCVLLFYDTTKSATRRWCSTACMNRARSRARHRARARPTRAEG